MPKTKDESTDAPAGVGHNTKTKTVNGIKGEEVMLVINKIESIESQKSELADQLRWVFREAKGRGFDVKTIRKILKLRKADSVELREEEMLLDIYLNALGMGPLFDGIEEAA